ncbi:MAG: tetratricopeptide repeat protein, partial [Deltaproteobacteria bacterium]|nr:tetratricopeptide repeat protein [Deltaproteobacteria bacterium]
MNWQELYELGKRAFEGRNYKEAQHYLEMLLQEKEGFADIYNMLGFIYHTNGRHEEAIRLFQKAIEINPNYTEASLNLVVAYNEAGEVEKGQELYSRAKKVGKEGSTSYLDPYVKGKLANMHADIGAIYQDLGFYEEAIEEYKKALALRPNFVDIKTKLGVVYRDSGEYTMAIKELEEVKSVNPNYVP